MISKEGRKKGCSEMKRTMGQRSPRNGGLGYFIKQKCARISEL
jgi:hypothetical protein